MKKYYWLGVLVFNSYLLSAQISGTVFRDFNTNGFKNVSTNRDDAGPGCGIIKDYNVSGIEIESITSAAFGTYLFTGLTLPLQIGSQDCSVEIYNLSLEVSAYRFIPSLTTNNAINNSSDYTQ